MNQTPLRLTYFIVGSIAAMAIMGLGALCVSMFFKIWAEPVVLTAIITLTGNAFGSLTTLLVNTRSTIMETTTKTDSAGAITTSTKPVVPVVNISPSDDVQPVVTPSINDLKQDT